MHQQYHTELEHAHRNSETECNIIIKCSELTECTDVHVQLLSKQSFHSSFQCILVSWFTGTCPCSKLTCTDDHNNYSILLVISQCSYISHHHHMCHSNMHIDGYSQSPSIHSNRYRYSVQYITQSQNYTQSCGYNISQCNI